ncbi:MAG: isochorismatase hydrolase [Bryobacterales bacterium]|nr:isochorismatase hydrolase [Bryobacterales bacterium]
MQGSPNHCFFDIDTQLDFLFPAGALYAPGAERLIPTIGNLNRYAAANGCRLISTTCAHTETADEFKVWPPHCILGTVGQTKPASTLLENRIVVPLTPLVAYLDTAQQIILEKNELDLFTNPNLVLILDRLQVAECTVYGVLTEYCVKHAALGLLATGRKVRLVTDAILHLSEAAASQMRQEFRAKGGLEILASDIL